MPHRQGHRETSFARTMSKVGQEKHKRPIDYPNPFYIKKPVVPLSGSGGRIPARAATNAASDAEIARGYGYRNPTDSGVALAQTLGMDQMSPAGRANFHTNYQINAVPGAPNVTIPTSRPGITGVPIPDPAQVPIPVPSSSHTPLSLQVAPMLDVFRNDPEAMKALSTTGVLPGYIPQHTGLPMANYPWEGFAPTMGSMATQQHGMGSWFGRGSWEPKPPGINWDALIAQGQNVYSNAPYPYATKLPYYGGPPTLSNWGPPDPMSAIRKQKIARGEYLANPRWWDQGPIPSSYSAWPEGSFSNIQ